MSEASGEKPYLIGFNFGTNEEKNNTESYFVDLAQYPGLLERAMEGKTDPFNIESTKLVSYMRKVLRHLTYTIGWVAGRLIQRKQDDSDDTLAKLNVLQGGIENRFIPGLSAETKVQIEGSFKITGDKEQQKLALSEASSIQLEDEDKLFSNIIDNND